MSEADHLLDHFFRHESAKLVSALIGAFGPRHIELAEDVAQTALLEALEAWRFGTLPDNPSGWLFQVARNKALDALRHNGVRTRLEPDIAAHISSGGDSSTPGEVFLDRDVADNELRMMFACCDPELPAESRVALTLKALCGFSTGEIADDVIRRHLCEEAMRLVQLLIDHPAMPPATSRALLALMSFHTARFDARLSADGDIVLLHEQDRNKWDGELIATGLQLLEQAAESNEISTYHLVDATLGELYLDAGDRPSAKKAFLEARDLTSSRKEKSLLDRKLRSL